MSYVREETTWYAYEMSLIKPKIVFCECSTHAISVDSWDQSTLLTFWSNQGDSERGRFYWAWQAIKGNRAGGSEVLLSHESTKELISTLKAANKLSARHLHANKPQHSICICGHKISKHSYAPFPHTGTPAILCNDEELCDCWEPLAPGSNGPLPPHGSDG